MNKIQTNQNNLEILSLLAGLLALFFSENKLLIMWIIFFGILILFGYNYYQKNESKFSGKNNNLKEKCVLFISDQIIEIIIFTFLIFYLFLKMAFFPEKVVSTLIILTFFMGIIIFTFNKKLKLPIKQVKYPKEFLSSILTILLIFLIFWGLSFYFNLGSFTILSYLIYTWPFFVLILLFTGLRFFIIWRYNKLAFSRRIKKIRFNWKFYFQLTIFVIFLIIIMLFLILLPQKHSPIISSIDTCHDKYVYEITSNNKVFNSYIYSIQINDFSNLNITLSGIFDQDGEYKEISLFEKSFSESGYYFDKKYLQYFEVYTIYEPSMDLLILRFYNKRMELFDSLKVIGIKNIC